MKVFYHNDFDGQCSAFWVRYFECPMLVNEEDFIEMNYGIPFPIGQIEKNETVWILDYSIEVNLMNELLAKTPNVIWIDHHVSAIEKYDHAELQVQGLRAVGISGCELTYWFCKKKMEGLFGRDVNDLHKRIEIPLFTRLIGDRDIWKFAYGKKSSLFHLGLQTRDMGPLSTEWGKLMNIDYVGQVIKEGSVIEKFRDQWAKNYRKSFGTAINFEGYKCYALNLGQCGSEYFKDEDCDIMISYAKNARSGLWTVSLYSESVCVRPIAEKHGGGGHDKAAGFVCRQLPF